MVIRVGTICFKLSQTVESHFQKLSGLRAGGGCPVYFDTGKIWNLSGLVVIAGSRGGPEVWL